MINTIGSLLVVLALNVQSVPADVQQECEDHIAALRIVQGVEVVYDCELRTWLTWESWEESGD